MLLESSDVRDFLGGLERLDSLARRDGKLLARYRQIEARKAADIAGKRP